MVVTIASGRVLFEATDPARGFISDHGEIDKRLAKYRENKPGLSDGDKNYYLYSFRLFHEVNLNHMLGLLHYNEAIKAYNDHQLPTAVSYLDKAMRLYDSPRMEEFSKIILHSINQSKLDASVKANCVKRIQTLRQQKVAAIGITVSDKP